MNPIIARLYGMDKMASQQHEEDTIDLSQISAAEYLEVLADLEEQEKVAGDDIDLSQISAAEYLEVLAELEEQEKVASEDLAGFEVAGRLMARAYVDEMSKVAYEMDDEEVYEIDPHQMSAADFLQLQEEGFEIEFSKEASWKARVSDAARSAYGKGRSAASRGGQLLSAKNVRGSVNEVAGAGAGLADKGKAYMSILRGTAGNAAMTSEARKSLAAQAAAAGALGTTAVGGGLIARRRKNRQG